MNLIPQPQTTMYKYSSPLPENPFRMPYYLSRNSLNTSLQSPNISTPNPLLSNLLAILQEHKGRHSSNIVLLRNGTHLIHINLNEAHIGVLLAQLADLRRNSLAGTAPGRVEVDNSGAGGSEGLEDDIAVVGERLDS